VRVPGFVRSALILAGGRSRRFGGPKALVEIEGRASILRVADAVAPLVAETIVAIEGPKSERGIRSLLPDATFVHDARPNRGPIEGLRQGFRVARGETVLVAPCDAPFLRTELYSLLLDNLGDHEVAAPKLEVIDPVRAVYRRKAALKVLDGSESIRSPSALIDRLQGVFLPPDELRKADPELSSFLDVNTRPELEAAERKMGIATKSRGKS